MDTAAFENVPLEANENVVVKNTETVRQINDAEKQLLPAEAEGCNGSNVHLWSVVNDFANSCSMFSSLTVIAVALGGEHILVLTVDLKVYAQGSNTHGQLGQGDTEERTGLCLVAQLNDKEVKRVACGARHSAVVCKDGSLYAWGDSRQGQCGVGAKGIFTIPTKINFARPPQKLSMGSQKTSHVESFSVNIKQVSCGELFTMAVDSRGAVWTWGSGFGLGHGEDSDECIVPTLVKGLRHRKVINSTCGSFHCIVITQSMDSSFNLPSPDYIGSGNVPSNEQAYATSFTGTSTVPFLQSTFYSSGGDEEIESGTESALLMRSHSESDILTETLGSATGELESSSSAMELGKASRHQNKMEENLNLIDKAMLLDLNDPISADLNSCAIMSPDTHSSQYYSALDVFHDSTMTVTSRDVINEDIITSPITEISTVTLVDNEDNISTKSDSTLPGDGTFLETISIKTIDSDCSVASSCNPDRTIMGEDLVGKFGDENDEDVQESLFDGRTCLFDEHRTNYHGYNVIERTSTFQPYKPKVFRRGSSIESNDDEVLQVTLETEIWGWGKNSYGQLGIGGFLDCPEPTLVKKLCGKGAFLLAAGSYHSLAVTIHGQVYSWGDNTFGQLAQTRAVVDVPKKVKALANMRIWDVSAGRTFSLLLGDRDKSKTDTFFCGAMESEKSAQQESLSTPVVSIIPAKKKTSAWKLSRRSKRHFEEQFASVEIQIRKLVHMEKELVRCVLANDYAFGCITKMPEAGGVGGPIYKFARAERLFHHQLTDVQKNVTEPFMDTESWQNIIKMPGGVALMQLVDSFVDLLNGISTELAHLTDFIRYTMDIKELFSGLFSDSFRAVYDRYSICYSDALAVGLFQSCNKASSSIISKSRDLMKEVEKHWSLSVVNLETLLKAPLLRAHVYCDIAKRIKSENKNNDEHNEHLKEVISRWVHFNDMNTQRMISAGVTYKFWNECNSKMTDTLKDPKRRVLKSSKSDPLSLQRASRLSSHSFILCNDVFVHVQFNRNFQVYSLVTLWADSVPESDTSQNAFKITSPEDTFILVAGTSDGKIAWLTKLNQAIASCLSACSSHSLDMDAVNASSGLLKAAVAREAQYTYVNHLQFRSATYKGMWFDGLPHGRGRMTWEDGVYYEGEFLNGTFQGHGQMIWPPSETSPHERKYDGEWVEGKMSGHGVMTYAPGEEYVGNFRNGYRHGYGTLKTSLMKTSIDTVYVGDWKDDVRSGYGVLDYIVRGEKYMGMWSGDQRNGYGLVVTVDGVYYEGNFFQNKLLGKGILLNEDETCYEGEFTADMLLSGKGTLTLPNGDNIEGTFYGKWGDQMGIKVNGIFSTNLNPRNDQNYGTSNCGSALPGTSDFTIDADLKWSSLFEECLAIFGCENTTDFDSETAWKNVNEAVLKASGPVKSNLRHSSANSSMYVKKTNFKEEMALAYNLKGLQDYLAIAFDTHGHPLNILVDTLVEVYRSSYVGVGAHRRLLPHAVAEAKSYVSRIFSLLRVLFPGLHDEEFVLLTNDTVDGIVDHTVNSMSLLHPLILPRLYPTLFILYALRTEKTDNVYLEKLHYLNKRGDAALMSFLGIKRTFWLISESTIASEEEGDGYPKPYSSAIENLAQISTIYSPMGKIEIIRRTFAKIHEEIEAYHKGVQQVLAMDDLFPLFQYIVIRARVLHLGSEIQFIEDLVEASVLVGEAGHMVTTLSACYFQIQQESDRIDKN